MNERTLFRIFVNVKMYVQRGDSSELSRRRRRSAVRRPRLAFPAVRRPSRPIERHPYELEQVRLNLRAYLLQLGREPVLCVTPLSKAVRESQMIRRDRIAHSLPSASQPWCTPPSPRRSATSRRSVSRCFLHRLLAGMQRLVVHCSEGCCEIDPSFAPELEA
jgi:hypothetical protein